MEASPIVPAKAGHQSTQPEATGGLGDLFQVLLREASHGYDYRQSVLSAIEARQSSFEPRFRFAEASVRATEFSSLNRDREVDQGPFRKRTEAASTRSEPSALDDEWEPSGDDAEIGVADAPERAAADDASSSTDRDAFTEPAAAPGDNRDTTPEAAATTRAGAPSQNGAAKSAADRAQAAGASETALQAVARTATLAQNDAAKAAQAKLATSATPSAIMQVGIGGGAARVEVTPGALVAPPNAALGGGAATAALAAQAAREMAAGTQAKQSSGTLPAATAASQTAVAAVAAAQAQGRPAARDGQNGTAPTALSQTGEGQAGAQGASGSSTAVRNELTGGSGSFMADAQGSRAQGTRVAGASTQIGQSPAASDSAGGSQYKPSATGAEPQQPAQTHEPGHGSGKEFQNFASPGARADAAAHGSQPHGAMSPSAALATGNGLDRAATLASAERSDGAGQGTSNTFGAGTIGLSQAAARAPQQLPAQARFAALPVVPADQVAIHIQRAAANGQDRIRIRLHPSELGQIDVKLHLLNDGGVKAIISVERAETLDLLQRDARGLERALQDAGLKTDSGSLNFNLRGEGRSGFADRDDDLYRPSPDGTDGDSPQSADAEVEGVPPVRLGGTGILDIVV